MLIVERAGLLALGALLLASCGSARDMIKTSAEIQKVETEVSKHLAHKNVDAYLLDTSDFLTIEIRNSPLRDLPSAEKRPKALQVAQLAYKTYASRSSLKVIDVVFVVDKTESSALMSSREYNAMDHYEFRVSELGAASPSPDASLGRK